MTNSKTLYSLTIALLIALSLSSLQTAQAQNVTQFTTQDTFKIPAYNGTIRFAYNGSYTSATLENDTWVFNNLAINTTFPLGDLRFSAKNCDVTIYTYYSMNYNSRRLGYIRYYVQGDGEQAINLGFNSSRQSDPSEWTIIAPGSVFLADGQNWHLMPDNTIIVNGVTGNLTVARYNYGYPVDNRPFIEQHSIIITTGVAVAIIVAVATIIKLKTRRTQ